MPTFNHSREDGPYDPCPICKAEMEAAKKPTPLKAVLGKVLNTLASDLTASQEWRDWALRLLNRLDLVEADDDTLRAEIEAKLAKTL